jgi:deferrochelatase/peroxidase EfeB
MPNIKMLPSSSTVPLPILTGPYQPGITDPQWPVDPPKDVSSERYATDRAGRVGPQRFVLILAVDVIVQTREELVAVLKTLTKFAKDEMNKGPSKRHLPLLEELPDTQRVTVTVGFGAPLFLTGHGDDRFGLNQSKPRWLKIMDRVQGDAFDPHAEATDLLLVVASDHPYVNVAIARSIIHGYVDKHLVVRRVEQGFSRPDKREFLRFDDGIDNLSNARDHELDRHVYVAKGDGEPDWCVSGAYLVWRKIREALPIWEALSQSEREGMIGREQESGKPLSRKRTGPARMTPVYPNPEDAKDGPLTAHIRKVQPRRPGTDFTGTNDLERRFLRRAYPFFDGLDGDGKLACGLLFMAYMRNLRKQFEWPVHMWQLNPDFPAPDTGIDAMYGKGVFSNIAGGFYFCPPAPKPGEDLLGARLFE